MFLKNIQTHFLSLNALNDRFFSYYRHQKNSGCFNGIRTPLPFAGAMLYQLSYEATQLGAGQFVG